MSKTIVMHPIVHAAKPMTFHSHGHGDNKRRAASRRRASYELKTINIRAGRSISLIRPKHFNDSGRIQ